MTGQVGAPINTPTLRHIPEERKLGAGGYNHIQLCTGLRAPFFVRKVPLVMIHEEDD